MPTVSDYVVRVRRYQAGAGARRFVGARCHSLGMPRTSSFSGLGELLAKQSSVVSRAQLLALGMKDNTMQYRVRRGGRWQTLVPRAVADTVRQLTELRDVRAVVADAVQLGRCTVSQLAEELRDGPMRGSAMFRSVLAEVAGGIRSTAEGDLGELIRIARLPMPMFNPSLYAGDIFLGKPDAWRPDAGVAGEVDSRAWHLSP